MRPTRRIRSKAQCPVVLDSWNATKLHPSHNLRVAHGALWCVRCGCFAADNVRKLASVGKDRRLHGANTLKRIRRGLTPVAYMKDWPNPTGAPYREVLVPGAHQD